jgi:nucleotide-binding universal stress UspA family protein
MGTTAASTSDEISGGVQLARVLCGIDGSDTDAEAVRQAAVIAGPEGQLEIVCVTQAPDQAEQALASAQAVASEAGASASARVIHDEDVWHGLAGATTDRDLLVLGGHPHSRISGIVHHSVATRALHDSAIPVLITRPGAADFPQRVLVATDGSTASTHAVALAAALAKSHSSTITLLTIDHVEIRERRHALMEQGALIARACGAEPEVVLRTGDADKEIVAAARQLEPSLLVIGSGGKHGLRAVGSVSEKVAHTAPCSVLVARPLKS